MREIVTSQHMPGVIVCGKEGTHQASRSRTGGQRGGMYPTKE